MLLSLGLYAQESKNGKEIPKAFKFTVLDLKNTRKHEIQNLEPKIAVGCPTYSQDSGIETQNPIKEANAIGQSFELSLDKFVCHSGRSEFYLMLVENYEVVVGINFISFAIATYNDTGTAEVTLDGSVLSEMSVNGKWGKTTPQFIAAKILVERIY